MSLTGTNKKYAVNEIFYSLQGEGYFTGTAAVFLRFSGCNRRCDFCDTNHSAFTLMSTKQIISLLTAYPTRHIVITGGEPMLQVDDNLIDALHSAGFFITVETNGSKRIDCNIDWVTCSPKTAPLEINRIDELKIVYQSQDVESIKDSLPEARHYFLQPCSGINTAETVAYIKSHPWWRLSLQTHKLIDIP
ncbi:MAG: 7-carboxy-7-deazaguanine synthase QueE [Paramuribaculum sp.]|nr:7-carboxy-7-deazaguanine synthase QueE [Paramuribaculum sp.]